MCGYAPRLRLDVVVNILTNHAVNTGRIKVFGGDADAAEHPRRGHGGPLLLLLQQPDEEIDGKVCNAGYENLHADARSPRW